MIPQKNAVISISIPVDDITLEGNLTIPENTQGIVVFAHGSGSSRLSPRNRFVADTLHKRNLATLLIDLLTSDEEKIDEQTRELRFDIPMLADRLVGIAKWLAKEQQTKNFLIGYFGASTGGGAALIAAAQIPNQIAAVVSRGGRPDLAGSFLPQVKAPVLLIVGGNDPEVLALNQQALEQLNKQSKLEIVPGATHLFEESGTLEIVAKLTGEWFEKHFNRV